MELIPWEDGKFFFIFLMLYAILKEIEKKKGE